MKIKLIRYARGYAQKKWVLFHKTTIELEIPLSAIAQIAHETGAYRVVRSSNKLVYFKHLSNYDIKDIYTYVS